MNIMNSDQMTFYCTILLQKRNYDLNVLLLMKSSFPKTILSPCFERLHYQELCRFTEKAEKLASSFTTAKIEIEKLTGTVQELKS